jgi:hypothetical protein
MNSVEKGQKMLQDTVDMFAASAKDQVGQACAAGAIRWQ